MDRYLRMNQRCRPYFKSTYRPSSVKATIQTVEVTGFMRRGNPPPVAVPRRDFGNEGRGGLTIRVARSWGKEGYRPAIVATAINKKVKCFMTVSPFGTLL